MKRLLAAATAIALAAIGVAATDAAATEGPGGQARALAFDPKVTWGKCSDPMLKMHGAQCGFVTVPLDYKNPDGATIELAVSRVRHTVPDRKYQGVMLVNPGGPGGEGQALSVLGSLVPKNAGAAYDWIGFDPRGVGASKPALRCDKNYAGYNRPEYVPRTREIEKAWLLKAKGYAEACAKAGGGLLEHLKTQDTVRDMENIRIVLGARQINFYGFSYGTYLGQVYATQYPSRVRRMVLDSNVNPARVWYDSNIDQDIAFDRSIKVFFGWMAENQDVFRVGRTAREVERRYYAEHARLAKKPAGGKIGSSELTDIFLQAGYYRFYWNDVARAYSAWVRKKDAAPLIKIYDEEKAQLAGGDNGYAVYLAVQCTDAPWPQSWAKWTADNDEAHRKAPFETWGNAWFNAPCRDWPASAGVPPTVSGETVPPLLLINETLDAATPFSGSLEVRKRFPKSRLIEGVGGTTHAGSLWGNRCVDDTIADYLATGKLPKRLPGDRSDKRCPPIAAPVASLGASPAKRAVAESVRIHVQRQLIGR